MADEEKNDVEIANRIVVAVMRDLRGRCGILDDVDAEVQGGMVEDLNEIVLTELRR